MGGDNQDEFKITSFPAEYIKKKRLYIVRNLKDIN